MKSSLIRFGYQKLYKPILFKKEPDVVHEKHIKLGAKLSKTVFGRALVRALFFQSDISLKQELFSLNFNSPIGLSEGFDKNAEIIDIAGKIGFGFAHVGSVTWKPYGGNPQPWTRRLPESKALVVNYGLKNLGIDHISKVIESSSPEVPISISIAKTNSKECASDAEAIKDYCETYKIALTLEKVSIITINISCPNTYGGEPFTTPERLDNLLTELLKLGKTKPMFLKMPLLYDIDLHKSLVEVAIKHKVDALIIANLEKKYSNPNIKESLPTDKFIGGISGKPTFGQSNILIAETYKTFGNKIKIIGVGGVFSAEDAYKKIRLGASLVQLITGMIYEGPQLIGDINTGLAKLLKIDGFQSITEAIGAEHRS